MLPFTSTNSAPTDKRPISATELPPVGMITEKDHGKVINYLSFLALESRQERDKWTEMADVNLCIFNYGDYPKPNNSRIVINRIQNAVIAVKDIQFKEPPTIELSPVETGGVMGWYWAGPDQLPMPQADPMTGMAMIDPMTGQPVMGMGDAYGALGIAPPMPDEQTGELVAQPFDELTAMGLQQQCLAMGWPSNWIVRVDDKYVGDLYQKPFDVYWKRAGTSEWADNNVLGTNIRGWNIGFYEFDRHAGHIIRDHSIRECFLDPQQQFLKDMQYAGIDTVLDAYFAKKLYPHIAAQIDATKQPGLPYRLDANTTLGQQDNRNFYRDTVTMRIFWLRDQPKPMTLEEALEAGEIEQREVIDTAAPVPDAGPQSLPGSGSEDGVGGGDVQVQGAVQGEPAPVPTVPAYFLAGTDIEITPPDEDGRPTAPQWPMRLVLRRLTVLHNAVVGDQEEEHWDIPLTHNVAVTALGTPYGFGLPWKLRHPQRAYSDMCASIVRNTDYLANPASVMPQSVKESLKEDYDDAHVNPGRTIGVPDDLYIQFNGKIETFIAPPAINEGVIQGRNEIRNDMDDLSGNVNVLRGEAPTSDSSGKLVEALQGAAVGLITALSKRTQQMLWHLARLQLHAIVHFATVDDIYRIVRKIPRPVLAAIHLGHARNIHWDVEVSIVTAAGLNAQNKRVEAIEQLQIIDPGTGEPIRSLESVREACDLDNEVETQRNYAAKMRAAAMGMGQDQSSEEEDGDEESDGKKKDEQGKKPQKK